MILQKEIVIETKGQGLYLITDQVSQGMEGELPEKGLLNLFIQHTSASLVIQESADPSAREDLEEFLNRLVPEHQAWHKHTFEGPDDTVSHMKSILTQTTISIPVLNGHLALGTWQGIYLWEHRRANHERRVLLTLFS